MGLFTRPTSAILCGAPGALLDWVALALAQENPGGFFWTDVRMEGQPVDPADPIARARIPADRFSQVEPEQLAQQNVPSESAVGAALRSGKRPAREHQSLAFLTLPTHTKELLGSRVRGPDPVVLVLSNGQRIGPRYHVDLVGPMVRAIVQAGASLLVNYADEPPQGRLAFDHVWHVRVDPVGSWKTAVLEVEKGSFGSTGAGGRLSLRDIPAVSRALSEVLDRTPPTR